MDQQQCGMLERDGFLLLPGVFGEDEAQQLAHELDRVLAQDAGGSALDSRGTVYAARNVVELYPAVRDWWRKPALVQFLTAVLGPPFGLVRVLFFDKPPGRSWSLPWHQDKTIAVTEHLPSTRFTKPTRKAGVTHVEAPRDVLAEMLTLRVHLDAATEANGPLMVMPGSHRGGVPGESPPPGAAQTIYAKPGDVLAMRPLVAHASGTAQAGLQQHRRILHLEFAGSPTLDDGYRWQMFVAGVRGDPRPLAGR